MSQRILFIDDESDLREVVQVSLELTQGWEVITARSGREGLIMARADHPAAILLDVMMPDMDGASTFQRLQTDGATRHIPVILLTAKAHAADRHRFAEWGVTGVITKPFDPLDLGNRVARMLRWCP